LFPNHTAEYGAYALVGMGAVLAGTTHAPIMAIMMIFEQTNSYQIILPLMFVCIISNVTARLFKSESFQIESLRRRGVKLPTGLEEGVMQSLQVSDVLHGDVDSVRGNAPFTEVVQRFLKSPVNNLYVTDEKDRFLGAIPLHALKEMLHQGENLSMIIAQDLVDDTFGFVTPEMRLADTMEGFWSRHCERLPVVDNEEKRRLIGWISKRDLIGVYNQEILHKRQLLSRFTVEDGEGRKDVFVELPEGFRMQSLVVPERFTGRTLRDLGLRSSYNVQVLQISHRNPHSGLTTIEMPGPDSKLESDDRIMVIGTVVDIARLMCDMGVGLETARE
jgi:chloride channel protein, CIC family